MLLTAYAGVTDSENSYPLYLLEESVSIGYVDITNIENLDQLAFGLSYDYLFVVGVIADLADTLTFAELTPNAKLVLVKYGIGSYTQRLDTLGGDESALKVYSEAHNYNSLECREERMEHLAALIGFYFDSVTDLGINVIETLSQDIRDNIHCYVYFGRIGIVDGGTIECIGDYLNSTAGTSWELTGLRTKGWTPNTSATLDGVADILLNVLQNGIY